jgi:hypothetical protein
VRKIESHQRRGKINVGEYCRRMIPMMNHSEDLKDAVDYPTQFQSINWRFDALNH